MPLFNCEVNLISTWSKNCALTDLIAHVALATQTGNPVRPEIVAPRNSTFKISDTKLYVPVVILSAQDDNKLLEQLKTVFRRTIKWNKYKSDMTNQAKTDNLNYLVDPTFSKANRLFVSHLKTKEIELISQSISHLLFR